MKFEITMSRKTFDRIKEAWAMQDYMPRTDAGVIRELFILEGRYNYINLRDKVKIKKVED